MWDPPACRRCGVPGVCSVEGTLPVAGFEEPATNTPDPEVANH